MKKLQVIYAGWGERWPLGTLADTGREILFEYSAQAITRDLQLSPLHQPLPRAGAATVTFRGKTFFLGLPGFIADALPDGWGMLLMDRALRQQGHDPRTGSVLERLAIVGERAMGALAFEPAADGALPAEILQLKSLARDVFDLHADEGKAGEQLRHLMRLGGSPQGARPKVLVDFNARTGQVSSGIPPTGSATPWLIKFPAANEHREVCAVEELYARMARAAPSGGMDMPRSRFFDLGIKHSAFGVERFDRVVRGVRGKQLLRVPIMSLSALLEVDHRLPALDYEAVLLATLRITGDQRELTKAYARCVLNVVLHNRDDHSRNFAFRLDEQGLWKLSPVFDLTFSFGPGGEHATSVAGHGKDINRAHLMQMAKAGGLTVKAAERCLAEGIAAVQSLKRLARDLPIRRTTLNVLLKSAAQRIALLK